MEYGLSSYECFLRASVRASVHSWCALIRSVHTAGSSAARFHGAIRSEVDSHASTHWPHTVPALWNRGTSREHAVPVRRPFSSDSHDIKRLLCEENLLGGTGPSHALPTPSTVLLCVAPL